MKPFHDCIEGDRYVSNYYFKDMMTGDITVSSGTPVSSITISADSIRMETCLGECCFPAKTNCAKTNCINCGAPLSGEIVCRYCDTYNR